MRSMLAAFALTILSAVPCSAQEERAEAVTKAPDREPESYLVELTEFRLVDAAGAKLPARELIGAFDELCSNGKIKVIETIQLSALEAHETTVQFGKNVAVTVGATTTQFGKARNMQERLIGTKIKLKAIPHNGKVIVTLSYDASRLSDNGTDDSPPDMLSTQYSAMFLLERDVPKLLGGSSIDSGSYLKVSLSEQ